MLIDYVLINESIRNTNTKIRKSFTKLVKISVNFSSIKNLIGFNGRNSAMFAFHILVAKIINFAIIVKNGIMKIETHFQINIYSSPRLADVFRA